MNGVLYVYLYSEPTATTLDVSTLGSFVKTLLPQIKTVIRDSFIPFHLSPLSEEERKEKIDYLAQEFAKAKVRDPAKPIGRESPLFGEISYEKRRLSAPVSQAFGLLYDGIEIMKVLRQLIPRQERNLNHIHIIFTNQLLGTWDETNHRYHARVIICGFPSLISTSGIVEAPAKPREFYLLKQHYLSLGIKEYEIKKELSSQFQGKFIDYDDHRLTEVMKGYVMQALFYHLTGEPFCEDKNCRLYNSHWQEEVIQAQLESPYEFCPFHEKELQRLRNQLETIIGG